MKKRKPGPKKLYDDVIIVAIDKKTKKQFIEVSKRHRSDMSKLIRDFIKSYITWTLTLKGDDERTRGS